MSRQFGRVVSVTERPAGGFLTVAAAPTDDVLQLDDVSQFGEDPGSAFFRDEDGTEETVEILSVDPEEETLTLTAGIAGSFAIGTAVLCNPEIITRYAEVTITGAEDDTIEALVPSEVARYLSVGTRFDEDRERVTLEFEEETDNWVVDHVYVDDPEDNPIEISYGDIADAPAGVEFLDDLLDVDAPAPDDGDVLTWVDESPDGMWMPLSPGEASHPNLATHDALGLATDAELAAHTGDTVDAHDASAISIVDAGANYAATEVEAALAEVMDAEQAHEADASDAHDASAISNVPAGGIAATTVQAAIDELESEKAALASAVMDGDAAGGDLSGTYPDPAVVDDSHAHGAGTAPGAAHPNLATHDGLGLATDAELATHAAASVMDGDAAGGDLSGTYPDPSVVDDSHAHGAGTAPGAAHPDLATHDALGLATDAELAAHTGDAADAHDASAISSVPAGSLAATDVQAALDELDTEKAAVASAVMDGDAAGGDLSGTYPSPSVVDDSHSHGSGTAPGTAHPSLATHDALGLATDAEIATHVGDPDPHTGYVREADANWVDLTDSGPTTLHSHAAAPAAATTVEKDLGSTPTWQGKFTITDAGIDATKKIMCWQAPGPYTGKGSAASADEGTMDPILVTAVIPAAGSAVVHWETKGLYTPFLARHNDPNAAQLTTPFPNPADVIAMQRVGKVKGNVKFSYVAFG